MSLDHSTTYYWRVDEENGAFASKGPVWSFTTGKPEGLPELRERSRRRRSARPTSPPRRRSRGNPAPTRSDTACTSPDFYGERLIASGTAAASVLRRRCSSRPDLLARRRGGRAGAHGPRPGLDLPHGASAGTTTKPVPISRVRSVWGVGESPTLSWSASPGAVWYDVDRGREDDDSRFYTATQASITIGPLDLGWDYYWRVIAWNAAGAAVGKVVDLRHALGPRPSSARRSRGFTPSPASCPAQPTSPPR